MKVFTTVIIIALLVIVLKQGSLITQTRSDIVFSVCNQSRVSVEITETECGRLQDKWHREFLCQQANRDINNKCWVEVK